MSVSLISMDILEANLPSLENGNGSKSNGSHSPEQPHAIAKQYTSYISGVEAVHDLGNAFQNKLLMKDENLESGKKFLEEDTAGGSYKSLQKCATFPITISAEKRHEFELGNKSLTHSSSLPTARKLVSAMKGGREKEGMPPKKLSVSWAAEVYDPPPSSVSHYPKKKGQQQYKSNKRHGKGKHKGKNGRGASCPKDKKHNRKNGGRSERCLNSYADNDRVMSSSSNNYKSPLGFLDFESVDDFNGSESSCGSSFRGKACGGTNTMHFAYAAEAT